MKMSCGHNGFFYGSGPSCLKSQGSLQGLAWRSCSKWEPGRNARIQPWGMFPTPPYMTLRENFRKEITLVLRPRQLLNIKKNISLSDQLRYDAKTETLQFVPKFQKVASPKHYQVTDTDAKSFIPEGDTLQSLPMQGPIHEATFEMTNYASSSSLKPKEATAEAVVMKIGNSYLSCPSTSSPQLKLEMIPSLPNSLSGDMERFIFWKSNVSPPIVYSFESQSNKGFYIATSQDQSKQPVKMVKSKSQNDIMEFKVIDPSVVELLFVLVISI
ncbi:uncharacterized protein LOC115092868 [Rhinatrema bivittatum]|uniref:uncharacterized protein LOC115092868 n=1 Tax=Rhinatrema bivittatum TaxID=194408 RepID=UPI0011285E51|nr:uncharacterized protein LOC115092868 [Rhinatrema bivittatum]